MKTRLAGLLIGTGFVGAESRLRTAAWAIWWAAILSLALYFIVDNALRYFSWDPAIYKRYWDRAGWLLLHVASGIVALLVGPFQFWSGLRRRFARLHRAIGRVYLTSIAVSALAAFVLIHRTEVGRVFATGLLGLAIAWVSTSGLALWAIRIGQVAKHREWMIRSYVVTFGFVTFRLIHDALIALQIGTSVDRANLASWLCWTVPLLAVEILLQGKKRLRNRERTVPAYQYT